MSNNPIFERMLKVSAFDQIFIGEVVFGSIGLFVSLITSSIENRFSNILLTLVIFMIATVSTEFLAYKFHWDSDILRINKNEIESNRIGKRANKKILSQIKMRIYTTFVIFLIPSLVLFGVITFSNRPTSTQPSTYSQTTASVGQSSATPKQHSDVINVYLDTTPDTIDPTLVSTLDSSNYANHLFEGLYRYKWDGTIVEPGMAESCTVSTDGKIYVFKLRDSKWSDGQPVTADNFVFSWRRLVDPAVAAPYALDMGAFIKNGAEIVEGNMPVDKLGVEASIDNKTLTVTLENPCPYFKQIVAFSVFSPIRQDIVEKYGDDWTKNANTYLSNGPFKCLSYRPDDKLAIVPNPGYWDAVNVMPKQVNFLFLANDTDALVAFRSGKLDFDDVPPQEEVNALKADEMYGDMAEMGTYFISYNTQKEPLNNVLVRKALTLAIDTDFIANSIRQGIVKPSEAFIGDGFFTSGYEKAFRDGWRTYVAPSKYEANKVAAQQALADAGYPDGVGFPILEYLYNDNSIHAAIGEALQNMWKDVLGIDVELKVEDWVSLLNDRRNGNFEIARNGWIADYNDPATLLNLFMSNSGNNDGKYNNAHYDAKLNEANVEQDPSKRNQLLHEAEDILIGQDWALAPIYYYTATWAVTPELKDWGASPLGYKFFQKAHK